MSLTGYRTPAGGIQDVSSSTPLPVTVVAGGSGEAGGPTDSTGLPLPDNFDSLAVTFTRNAAKSVITEARTNGTNTWTQTFTRNGDDNVTNISQWVKT